MPPFKPKPLWRRATTEVWVRRVPFGDLVPPKGFMRCSDYVERYGELPKEVLNWCPYTTLEAYLGVCPSPVQQTDYVYVQDGKRKNSKKHMIEVVPCCAISDPCRTGASTDGTIPIPVALLIPAVIAASERLKAGFTEIDDWRRFKLQINKKTRTSMRVFLTPKTKTIVENWYHHGQTRRKIIVEHVMNPLEVALVRFLHDIGGARLIIPPSFRNQNYVDATDWKRLLVDPFANYDFGFDEGQGVVG